MLALPIFPASHPASIFGGHELNFCVRDGNRWTLMPINTNYELRKDKDLRDRRSLCWHYLFSRPVTRQVSSTNTSLTSVFGMGTGGPSCQSTPTHLSTCLSRSAASRSLLCGDPYGIRTHVNGVRGRCLNHLTNGPSIASASLLSPGPPSGTRTRDPLIKSQLLYQLS